MSITISNIPICSTPASTDYFINTPALIDNDSRNWFSTLKTDIFDMSGINADNVLFENDILIIYGNRDDRSRPGMNSIKFYDKANQRNEFIIDPTNCRHCYMALGYDDDLQRAYFFIAGQFYYDGDWDNSNPYSGVFSVGTSGIQTRIYELISGSQIPPERSGGAGSGYIGNSLLSNKKMVGYNVPTSSAESTKTESVNEASETPASGKPKIGNGFARIKLLRATSDISFFTSSLSSDLMVEDWDIANVKDSLTYGNPTMQPTMYSEFFLTEWNFNIGNQWAPSTTISNGELVRTGRGDNRSDAVFWIPVNRINKTIIKITADYKVTDQRHWGGGFDRIGFWVGYVDSNNEWHSVSLGNKYPDDENWHTGGEWVYNGTLIPYIDYIGIEGGDGIYHAKNIVLTVG